VVIASVAVALVLPLGLWMVRRPRQPGDAPPPLRQRLEFATIGLVVIAFAVAVVLAILQDVPFSWDESVYALIARHWVFGTPATGWGVYRPPVLSFLATVPMLVTRQEAVFRMIGLGFGCLTIIAVWLLGRRLAGARAGLVAAAIVASATPIQMNAGLLLNDVPSAGLVVLLLWVLWRVMEDPDAGWSMLWLAPVAAAAFYVRYGASVAIALIAVTALVLWPRRLLVDWRRVLATGALLVLLLLPHIVLSVLKYGSPWGIALQADHGAQGAYPGAALVAYAASLPFDLVGPLGAVVAVLGLLGGIALIARAVRQRHANRSTRAIALLLVPAVGQIVVLGIAILPQARYVFLAMILLIVAGSIMIAGALGALRGARRQGLGWVAAGVLGAYVLGSLVTAPQAAGARLSAFDWLRVGGRYIATHSTGPCSVLASDVPQVTWYSGCTTYSFGAPTDSGRDALLTGANRWLLLRRDGSFQPLASIVADYRSRVLGGSAFALHDHKGRTRGFVYRFPPAAP
jgi:4-amino-4-deoxy-L-arabinose transferase-like glycosyltransferase